jgi:hypothetical protein
MGMIDYGWYFYVDLACTNAVRDGTRVATTYAGACPNATATTQGTAAITNDLSAVLPPSYVPTVTTTCTTSASGDPSFQFSLVLNFPPITGFSLVPLPSGGGGTARVQTSATMRGVQ